MRRSPKKCVSCYYGSAKRSRFRRTPTQKMCFFRRAYRYAPSNARAEGARLQRVCACKLSRFSYDCSDRNGTNPRGESSPIAGDAVPSPSVAFGPAASVPALAILCRLDDRSTPFPPAAPAQRGGEPLNLRLQAGVLADHALHALLHLAQALHQRRVLRLVPADLLVQHRDVLELPPARPPRRLAEESMRRCRRTSSVVLPPLPSSLSSSSSDPVPFSGSPSASLGPSSRASCASRAPWNRAAGLAGAGAGAPACPPAPPRGGDRPRRELRRVKPNAAAV